MPERKASEEEKIGIFHPKVVLLSTGVAGGILLSYKFYNRFMRRIKTYLNLTPRILDNQRKLYGTVTRVGDGDNFRFYHTPGGPLMGWGWLRKTPTKRAELKDETLMIRLCGVDAPESAHFGKPAQPYSAEALEWLRQYLIHRSVTITPYSIDQYKRVVARAQVWKWNGRRDVSAEMLRNGLAVMYESKMGAEFGDCEQWYRKLEAKAKAKRRGLWSLGKKFVSPGEYKRKHD